MNTLSLDNAAIITGASSGIGRAAALALADRRLRLCLISRSEAALAEVESEVRARGASDVCRCAVDVRNESAVNQAVATALGRFGRIGILLNSAGLSEVVLRPLNLELRRTQG